MKETVKFDKYEVEVNSERLRFDETTLSNYIQTEGGFYDNFGAYLALAERNLQNKELQHEKLYCERFEEAKDTGVSDKMAEARSKRDQDVVEMKGKVIDAKYIVNRLKNHIKAWDKNHDNAQSLGHMLRKQMDKLNGDIMGSKGYEAELANLDKNINETVKEFSSDEFESDLTAENLF